jgi:geranylgeranyl diphosphate synthase, type II
MTRRLVLDAIPVGEPGPHLYHLVTEHLSRTAKALRPALCLATCRALGGSIDEALPIAAALELHHNAFLVHDDIADGSLTRSGRPTLHERHGVPLALNASDALTAIAVAQLGQGLRRLGRRRADAIAAEFDRLVRETVEGQALDLGWQSGGEMNLTRADYTHMAIKKTAWYTAIGPVRIGALLASGGSIRTDFGVGFGSHLGVMFQMANDLINLLQYVRCVRSGGTNRDSDIHEGKRTVMMIHLLKKSIGADREKLEDFLRQRRPRPDDLARWVLDRMAGEGSLDHALACLRGVANAGVREARHTFGALPGSPDRELLVGIFPYMLRALS